MTTITIDWEPEGTPKKDGRQAWRAEGDDPHYVATLRPENGAYGPYYALHLQLGTVDIDQECHCVEMGQLFARAWLEQMPAWNARAKVLLDEQQKAAYAAQKEHGPGYDPADVESLGTVLHGVGDT